MVAVSVSDDLYSSVDKQITNMQKEIDRWDAKVWSE